MLNFSDTSRKALLSNLSIAERALLLAKKNRKSLESATELHQQFYTVVAIGRGAPLDLIATEISDPKKKVTAIRNRLRTVRTALLDVLKFFSGEERQALRIFCAATTVKADVRQQMLSL